MKFADHDLVIAFGFEKAFYGEFFYTRRPRL